MAAPVVPIHDASAVPVTMIAALTHGEPRSVPRTRIPPPITNSVPIRMMNGT